MKPVYKHTGVLKSTSQRVAVIYRFLPEEKNNCLIVEYDRLPDMYKDNLFTILKTDESVKTNDLYTVLHARSFGDGQNCLMALHSMGYIKKVPVEDVTLHLENNQILKLSDLNSFLESVDKTETVTDDQVEQQLITPNDKTSRELAEELITQANLMEKEASKKKEQAYVLCPELRPSKGRPRMTLDEKRTKRKERNRVRREQYAEKKTKAPKATAS